MEKHVYAVGAIMLAAGLLVGYSFGGGMNHSPAPAPESAMVDGHGMADAMADMNAGLVGKTGEEFDKAFLAEMIVHHQGAVEMAELAQKHASHPEVKDLAEAIIAAQNKEIADMQRWQRDWFGH